MVFVRADCVGDAVRTAAAAAAFPDGGGALAVGTVLTLVDDFEEVFGKALTLFDGLEEALDDPDPIPL